MPNPLGVADKALFYWGDIESGTFAGESTADIWQRIRDRAESMGLDRPGISAQDVSKIRAAAGGVRSAATRLAGAPDEESTLGRYVGLAPWARPQEERNTIGRWQVRFEHQTFGDNGLESNWRTVMFKGQLPANIGDLRARISEDAQALADKYGVELAGVGSMNILEL